MNEESFESEPSYSEMDGSDLTPPIPSNTNVRVLRWHYGRCIILGGSIERNVLRS